MWVCLSECWAILTVVFGIGQKGFEASEISKHGGHTGSLISGD